MSHPSEVTWGGTFNCAWCDQEVTGGRRFVDNNAKLICHGCYAFKSKPGQMVGDKEVAL